MLNIAQTLDQQIRAAGIAIVGVSIGNATDKATWRVQPSVLQAQAQPLIDAVDLDEWERDEQLDALRADRNQRLLDSDYTQLDDVADLVDVAGWRVYRQALRDLPAVTVDPVNPVWPSSPVL